MFGAGGEMESVVFMKPDQTAFQSVDLRRVRFRGTNLRGVRFLDVDWWQDKLGRHGLFEEVWFHELTDGPLRHEFLPVLEETCRNARVALEENRSFDMASDFYIGEMDARRMRLGLWRRHFFSVPAIYRFVSNYGTNVGWALRILVYFYLLHVAATLFIASHAASLNVSDQLIDTALRSLLVLPLLATNPALPIVTGAQAWVDVAFRFMVPIQIAMLALAFRSRIKRH
jgi:hypothetical protein